MILETVAEWVVYAQAVLCGAWLTMWLFYKAFDQTMVVLNMQQAFHEFLMGPWLAKRKCKKKEEPPPFKY